MHKILFNFILIFLLFKEINSISISNKHNIFTRDVMFMLHEGIGQKRNINMYSLHNVKDNIEYGAIFFSNRANQHGRRIMIRGIKAKYINKLHIETMFSMLTRLAGVNWGQKLVIVCEDRSIVKDEARLNNKIVFIRVSDMLYYFNLER
jgi:hypothetical protein